MPDYPNKFKDLPNNNHECTPKLPTERLTFGQKTADKVTKIAGSWGFIISFLIFLLIWMLMNILIYVYSWDPYPFILLNLVLSCIAALQAPIILMSQNRSAERDRLNQRYDYLVDRKTSRDVETIMNELKLIKNKLNKVIPPKK